MTDYRDLRHADGENSDERVEQSANDTDRYQTGGWCFGCTETYSHDEWITRRYRSGGDARSAAFCPHCGRLQVSTRVAEDLVDDPLPDRNEVIEGNPAYLVDRSLHTGADHD